MNQIFSAFIQMCLMRTKPQDIPASDFLMISTAILVVLSYTVTDTLHDGLHIKLMVTVLQVLIFAAVVWLVLKIRNLEVRWRQTVTALFGTAAIFQLASLPFILIFDQGDQQSPLPEPLIVHVAIGFWYLAVMSHVLRHALDTSLARGVLAALFCQLSTVYVLLIALRMIGIDNPAP